GGGVFRVGGGVSAPVLLYKKEPEYSEEARKAKYQGTCTLMIVVDTDGKPTNLRVVNSLGMGLDEKALETVKTWRFEPGKKDGHPVKVEMAVEVDFHLY
ncbi:MAG: energy transducer TonB, partial [Candidatus Sulfotelmatobacter sp.]